MEFERLGEHTIKCVISEEEILEMGFTIEDILQNGARTQQFMNQIFDRAEQEFETKFELGIKTVRADFLSNHTLSLTFSDYPMSGIAEQIKDLVGGLLSSITNEKLEELKKAANQAALEGRQTRDSGHRNGAEEEEEEAVIALFTFPSLDIICTYAKQVPADCIPDNSLYRYRGEYYLLADLTDCTEDEVLRLSMITDEYATNLSVGAARAAFIRERARCILPDHAIEQLCML